MQKKVAERRQKDFHQVSDEIKEEWDLAGAAEDAQLLFMLGYRMAQERNIPEWKEGAEFNATRAAMTKNKRYINRVL